MFIDVPFQEKDQAKALGARWDPQSRRWYVPAGIALLAFEKWLPAFPSPDDPELAVLGLRQACWKCGERTTSVVACRENPDEAPFFADCDVLRVLASQLSAKQLAAAGSGPLRPRFSYTMRRSTWANGCVSCDALLGGFRLYEEFVAHSSQGKPKLPFIAYARVPLILLHSGSDS